MDMAYTVEQFLDFLKEERHTKRQLVLYQERTTSGQKQYLPCHEKALRKGRSKKG